MSSNRHHIYYHCYIILDVKMSSRGQRYIYNDYDLVLDYQSLQVVALSYTGNISYEMVPMSFHITITGTTWLNYILKLLRFIQPTIISFPLYTDLELSRIQPGMGERVSSRSVYLHNYIILYTYLSTWRLLIINRIIISVI